MKMLKLEQNPRIDTPEKLEKVLGVLIKNWNVFDITDKRVGRYDSDVKHSIITQGPPIRGKTRPLNPLLAKQVRDVLIKWEEQNIIRKSSSPWSSPIVVVPKKNGKIRVCADYRSINNVTLKNSWPLPHIESSLSNLANQNIFSILDAKDAYFAIEISEESIPKTAITTTFR